MGLGKRTVFEECCEGLVSPSLPCTRQHCLVKSAPGVSLGECGSRCPGPLCVSQRSGHASENQGLVLHRRQAVASFVAAQSSCRVFCTLRGGYCLTLKWKGLGFWMAFDGLFIQVLVLLYAGEARSSVAHQE